MIGASRAGGRAARGAAGRTAGHGCPLIPTPGRADLASFLAAALTKKCAVPTEQQITEEHSAGGRLCVRVPSRIRRAPGGDALDGGRAAIPQVCEWRATALPPPTRQTHVLLTEGLPPPLPPWRSRGPHVAGQAPRWLPGPLLSARPRKFSPLEPQAPEAHPGLFFAPVPTPVISPRCPGEYDSVCSALPGRHR